MANEMMICPQVRESIHVKMVLNMKENTEKERNMDMELTLSRMVVNIRDSGNPINTLEMAK